MASNCSSAVQASQRMKLGSVVLARLSAAFCALCLPATLVCGADEIKDSACMECHGDKTLTKKNAAGKEVSLFVDHTRLAASTHRTNTCASCHSDITGKHPDDEVAAKAPDCRRCHQNQSESY